MTLDIMRFIHAIKTRHGFFDGYAELIVVADEEIEHLGEDGVLYPVPPYGAIQPMERGARYLCTEMTYHDCVQERHARPS